MFYENEVDEFVAGDLGGRGRTCFGRVNDKRCDDFFKHAFGIVDVRIDKVGVDDS